jgi:hypothetical protein
MVRGYIDLDQELGIKSINASVLEFDFVPVTNFISLIIFFCLSIRIISLRIFRRICFLD